MLHFLPGSLLFSLFVFSSPRWPNSFSRNVLSNVKGHACYQWISLWLVISESTFLLVISELAFNFTCDQWISLFTCDQWTSLFTCDQWINHLLVISESTFHLWPDHVLNVLLMWPLTFVVYRVFNNTKNQPAVTMTKVTPCVPALAPHRDSLSPINFATHCICRLWVLFHDNCCAVFQFILHSEFLSADSLVVVERTPIAIHDQLEQPLQQKKFGTWKINCGMK